jgi:hypothetical protein
MQGAPAGALLLIVLFGHDSHEFGKDLLIFATSVAFMFFSSGYLLSTAIFRGVWRGQRLWSYPAVAALLFSVHFEILNVGVGGAFAPPDRLRIRVAGACIVFACTFVGGCLLRAWVSPDTKKPDIPNVA